MHLISVKSSSAECFYDKDRFNYQNKVFERLDVPTVVSRLQSSANALVVFGYYGTLLPQNRCLIKQE